MTYPPQQQPPMAPMAPPMAPRAGVPQAPPARAARPTTPTSARLAAALARSRAWARPAGAGARVAAFTTDLLVVLLIAALTWVFTKSLLIGVVVLLEAAVILAVLEARTGVTIGNLLLRMRTVRDDAPFSPGVARGAVRALVQGAGSLVGFVGGIAVAATSAADPMRMGRSVADRAGRTLVVKVPSNAERQAWVQGAEAWAASAQAMGAAQAPAVAHQAGARQQPAQPQRVAPSVAPMQHVAPAAQVPQQVQPQQRPQAQPQPQAHAQPQPQQRPQVQSPPQPAAQAQQPAVSVAQAPAGQAVPPILRAPAPARGPATGTVPPAAGNAHAMPAGVVPVDAPIATPPQPVRHVEVGEQLLLTFDTGQRAQLSIPVAVNLGRKPDRTEQDDQLVVVQDSEGTVSKTHLRLDYRGDSVWLTDLGSTNGSEILDDTGEGSLLAKGYRVRLEDGSRVRIGNRSFTVATVRGQG